jgi:hypothetical protein
MEVAIFRHCGGFSFLKVLPKHHRIQRKLSTFHYDVQQRANSNLVLCLFNSPHFEKKNMEVAIF